ncbi:predicted protein, partial [Nematostella vectensis]
TWQTQKGSTSSLSTGPSRDHTTGSGRYIYMEASAGSTGSRAIIRSKFYPPSNCRKCINFYWHMYGFTMGTVRLTYRVKGTTAETTVWQRSGNHNNQWHPAAVEIPQLAEEHQISFIGIRGTSFYSDAALDDFQIRDCLCSCG